MKRILIAMLLLCSATAWAEKAGLYIGAGITANNYTSPDDDDFKAVFEDERTTGWRAEVGYIWDLGKPGGFHMGVAGTYDSLGKAEGEENFYLETLQASFESSVFSVLFVIEQELASWADFVFKVGPAVVDYDLKGTYQSDFFGPGFIEDISDSSSEVGGTMVIGFTFFPTDYLAIELARQGTAFVQSSNDSFYDDDSYAYAVGTWSASLQYRF